MGKSALGRSKTVPRSSWFGPFFVLSFGIAFLVVLGSSWGRFWSSWAPLRVVFGRSGGRFGAFSAFQLIDSTRQLINSSIQLINSSTHQPMALRHFLTRPGGLRAARLNKASPPGFNSSVHTPVSSLFLFFCSLVLPSLRRFAGFDRFLLVFQ